MEKFFTPSFKRLVLPCMTAVLVLLAAGIARADQYTVTLEQAGTSVVATGSGSIGLAGLAFVGTA
ncbi:MAG: hypothetical protein ACRES9_08865, partial [Gammaproteobacteria bacterium]